MGQGVRRFSELEKGEPGIGISRQRAMELDGAVGFATATGSSRRSRRRTHRSPPLLLLPSLVRQAEEDRCRYYELKDDDPPYAAKFSTISEAPEDPI